MTNVLLKSMQQVFVTGVGLIILLLASLNAGGEQKRIPSSSHSFPRVAISTDTDDILISYAGYLKFVLEIGRTTDPASAKRLDETFQTLRKRDPKGAARFLKGLRFELVHKLELMGLEPSQVSTSTGPVRTWVSRYIKAWHREADEYLFRAVAVRPIN